ncbi:unnamed protein product, partial [Nippostrongylus brasiliensis]|uniref:Transposase n=1 Tax=Nippostrongylus brasiliensis TaxID=27835 RepID=A0A0N4Y8G4_NIPBR
MKVEGKGVGIDQFRSAPHICFILNRKMVEIGHNRKKTQFMKNSLCDEGHIELGGSPIAETKSYVYL